MSCQQGFLLIPSLYVVENLLSQERSDSMCPTPHAFGLCPGPNKIVKQSAAAVH